MNPRNRSIGMGKNRGRIILRGDFVDRLEIAELDRRRLAADDMRGLRQLLGGLQLAFRVG